jgi:hypothetical protein
MPGIRVVVIVPGCRQFRRFDMVYTVSPSVEVYPMADTSGELFVIIRGAERFAKVFLKKSCRRFRLLGMSLL